MKCKVNIDFSTRDLRPVDPTFAQNKPILYMGDEVEVSEEVVRFANRLYGNGKLFTVLEEDKKESSKGKGKQDSENKETGDRTPNTKAVIPDSQVGIQRPKEIK